MTRALRAAALLLFGIFGCTASAGATDAPFLWKVQGPRATHYLLGSVHMLPASAYPLPPALDAAYAQTRGLVLETDPAALEAPQTQASMIESGSSEGGLRGEIEPALYARMRQQAQASGLPAAACDRFKAWLCALTLTLFEFQRSGMDPALGLDRHFHQRALADRREVGWLETPGSQLDLFAGMDPAMSRQFLASALDDLADPQWRPQAMVRMWRGNDVATLGRLIDEAREDYPETHERLLARRNRAWIGPLVGKLEGATPQLVVVGAAHLAGQANVLDLLAARGMQPIPVAAP